MKSKKVILVTGASSGIGKDAALKLISEGHIVYGAARRLFNMEDFVQAGGSSIKMDITNHKEVEAAVEKIISEQGHIDVLINNAGFAVYGSVEDITIDEARQQFEVNIFGLGRITQLVIPYMRARNKGKIINISSIAGKMYMPLGAWYHASKHALEGWSDCLRMELEQFGIDVVVIEPGAIKTPFWNVMLDPLRERSKNGFYEKMAYALDLSGRDFYENKSASPVSVITDLISKAIYARRPKTRYIGGKFARLMVWMRKYLGDRIFDAIMRLQVNYILSKES